MATERLPRNDRWDEEVGAGEQGGEPVFKPLTREEAQALRARARPLSPWRVVGMQAGAGAGAALLAALIFGRQEIAWSVLYGAAAVVLPGALMARGMTRQLSHMSPGASAIGFMFWEFVKVAVSVAMLILAPRIVQPLVWPALLAGLVVGLKSYWLALLWRGRVKEPRA